MSDPGIRETLADEIIHQESIRHRRFIDSLEGTISSSPLDETRRGSQVWAIPTHHMQSLGAADRVPYSITFARYGRFERVQLYLDTRGFQR